MKKISFYNVRKKATVEIFEDKCTKCTYEKESKTGKKVIRYAVKAEEEGTKVTKFIGKADYDDLTCNEG